ncbi:UbiD family decarboxylase [Bythopirellula polymerisocia]|uniref:4-hydroxybenzoate decarboxylase subunit C n=1 Tax=Bythopirellula polymerisocia TaxID=2528003 RepID=A0A5C6CUL2_9BACT|nr:UbiD family decarboxylase [Bythopirellula polymerisocia]TWU28212.1 4-hydroxybenzoate decarboxylase subunit C [Bythopirellula polymerisocia]
MGYQSLQQCVDDLQRQGQLVHIDAPIDANLEAAAIQRRVVAAGGPALLFTNVVNCRFPMLANLFGTRERTRLIFRDGIEAIKQLVLLRSDPQQLLRRPWHFRGVPLVGLSMLPKKVARGPILANRTTISQLPQLKSWPQDGGAFVTLPQVYTEDVRQPGLKHSNLGMYRVQLSGEHYKPDEEIGLHYQIHRSIGVHHAAALAAGKPFRVNVFVGGPPAMTVAAVMPLPEGMSELGFAGALGGHRVRMISRPGELPFHADTDFCIVGEVIPDRLEPEGPFGDHLGYYSLTHPFPVMRVKEVYHRDGAIWPFTVVGRPPQEDSMLGELIHEITGPLIPEVLPGVRGVNAVDAAGVHPLLLAIGSERYMPFLTAGRPQEILTQASAILGQGQLSLAKFLLIVAEQDDPQLDIHHIEQFLRHLLQRADWSRDLHFHTQTTVDTLDYSGTELNAGSKVVMAAAGPARYELATSVPSDLKLPSGFRDARLVLPGLMAITGPRCPAPSFDYDVSHVAHQESRREVATPLERFCAEISPVNLDGIRWIVVVDESQFVAESLRNFLWVTFTRTNPAADLYGIESFVFDKHWGCRGPLVFDARIKPHHAPVLEEPPEITRRVDSLATPGGPLHGII